MGPSQNYECYQMVQRIVSNVSLISEFLGVSQRFVIKEQGMATEFRVRDRQKPVYRCMCTYAHTPGWGMCGLRRILGVCAVGACALLEEIRGCMCGLEGAYTTVEIQSLRKVTRNRCKLDLLVKNSVWRRLRRANKHLYTKNKILKGCLGQENFGGGMCGFENSIYTLCHVLPIEEGSPRDS
mgnify:CR=1 FL=1